MLVPDQELVKTIIHGLARNKMKHGRGYCPCMFVSGNPEEDKKTGMPGGGMPGGMGGDF